MINWNRYIAANQPTEVNSLLRSYGYPEAEDENESAEALSFIVEENGEKGFNDVFAIHPDYNMIIEHYKENYVEPLIEEKPKPTVIAQASPKVSSGNDSFFNNSVKEALTIVLLFWLVNKIISK